MIFYQDISINDREYYDFVLNEMESGNYQEALDELSNIIEEKQINENTLRKLCDSISSVQVRKDDSFKPYSTIYWQKGATPPVTESKAWFQIK